MRKKLLILLCSLLLSISLIGCGSESNRERVTYCGREFLEIYYYDDYSSLLVDVETRVQYLQIGSGQSARLTTIVDAEGKPILYEGDLEEE